MDSIIAALGDEGPRLSIFRQKLYLYCSRVSQLPNLEECKFLDLLNYRTEIIEQYKKLNKKYKNLLKELRDAAVRERMFQEYNEILRRIEYIESYLDVAEGYKSAQKD
jgi:hypothetical protein